MENDTMSSTYFRYLLRLGDTALIHAHRLSEWCGHGPILEEDIALTNISLDLLGQSRSLLTKAGDVEGKGRDEDALAFHRDERNFFNVLMAEQPNGDFAFTILKSFFISTFQVVTYSGLEKSEDVALKAIATKSLKEALYHQRHSGQWVVRLGDGTEESNKRLLDAINELWRFTDDLFAHDPAMDALVSASIIPASTALHHAWLEKVSATLNEATIGIPSNVFMMQGSIAAKHTEHLGYILAEMQVLPRMYPDAKW
ncbi:MAG: phenylacetic acid degradation protein [Bacteroidota bacterium]|jgi:ring-1,2-phenylacetyl-CoA epoxidase subunit PaaC